MVEEKHIKLGDFLKLKGMAESGGHAKIMIQSGAVRVNGITETRRGRKLRVKDMIMVISHDESGAKSEPVLCTDLV